MSIKGEGGSSEALSLDPGKEGIDELAAWFGNLGEGDARSSIVVRVYNLPISTNREECLTHLEGQNPSGVRGFENGRGHETAASTDVDNVSLVGFTIQHGHGNQSFSLITGKLPMLDPLAHRVSIHPRVWRCQRIPNT